MADLEEQGMLTNEAEFEVLLTRYEDDPGMCSKLLRAHSLSNPKIFLQYAQNALLTYPVSRALRFIAGLALSAGLMDQLIEMHVKARPRCMQLAQKLMACDPRFDLTFLEHMMRVSPNDAGEENLFHVGLDILDLISQGDRLVPGVLKILKHHNPKVRSKAALFIGSRTQNLAWAASRTQEYDARVRANIIESLQGINSDFVYQIFRNNVGDENNRVAGNAILGLYQLGDTSAIPLMLDLARHPDARFRNTCAWMMGRTGDPRFASVFSELINDSDELVRAQAFKGLGELRKAMRLNASRPELRAAIAKLTTQPAQMMLTVSNDSGMPVRGIAGTGFVVRTGVPAKLVRHFSVEEHDCRSPLNVAFVICPPEPGEPATEAMIKAIEACAPLRRSKDRWAIAKLNPKCRPRLSQSSEPKQDTARRYKWTILQVDTDEPVGLSPSYEPYNVEYSNVQLRIDSMLRSNALMMGRGATDDASRVLLNSLLRSDSVSGNPHLIFLGSGPEPHLVESLQTRSPEIAAHVHVVAESEAWRSAACSDLSQATGGIYREVNSPEQLTQACFDTYASLLHHYRISWKDAPADSVELDIRCEEGRAACCYQAPSEISLAS